MTQLKLTTLGLALFFLAVSCTKTDANRIDFASPLKFSHDSNLPQGENIAMVDGEGITSSQLYSPSPALQELESRMQKIVMIHVYEQALATGEEQTITFGYPAPKDDMKKIVGAKWSNKIEVKFDETQKADAKIGDKVITREELASNDQLLSRLMSDSFQQKMQALEGIVARRKILGASKAAGIGMEDFIQKNILASAKPVTETEVVEYAKKNNITEKELTDELKAQLKDIVTGRRRDHMMVEYAGANLMKDSIKVGFTKPRVKIALPAVGEAAPQKGKGPIVITLFSYVQCQDCKEMTRAVSSLVDSNPKYYKVNYVFNFPMGNNEERMVAEASMCLKKQKEDFFWQFPDRLQKNEEMSLEDSINSAAKAMGVDYEAFRTCFLAREFKDAVEAHLQGTKNLGFHRSPVVVLDGTVYEVPGTNEVLERAQEIKVEKGLGFNFFYKIKKFFAGT